MSTKNVINDKQGIATELTDNKVLHKKKPGRKKKEEVVYSKQEKEIKYLEFLNWINKKLGDNEIDQIGDFKNVSKNRLETIDIDTTVDEWSSILFPTFGKKELDFYKRKFVKVFISVLLRNGAKAIGTKLDMVEFKKQRGNTIERDYIYTIN